MRIAVTGGRDYQPTPEDEAQFWKVWHELGGAILFEGGATGADEWARNACRAQGFPVATIAVTHRLDGPWPAAGPIRSVRMLEDGMIERLIAFPGGRVTAGTVRHATRLDIPVHFIGEEHR